MKKPLIILIAFTYLLVLAAQCVSGCKQNKANVQSKIDTNFHSYFPIASTRGTVYINNEFIADTSLHSDTVISHYDTIKNCIIQVYKDGHTTISGQRNIDTEVPENWIYQDIDNESNCDIKPCAGMKIIKIGKSYTATYNGGSFVFYKANKQKTGLDFYYTGSETYYYKDSCKLKEDLRGFIKLKMVQYINANTK